MARSQFQSYLRTACADVLHRKLADEPDFMLHIHIQIVRFKQRLRLFQYLQQLAGR